MQGENHFICKSAQLCLWKKLPIQRFNRTYREDVLGANLFSSLQEVHDITEEWIEEYNTISPHEALQGLPPYQYLAERA